MTGSATRGEQGRAWRPVLGLGVGLVLAAAVAMPVFGLVLITLVRFNGCLIGVCAEPDPQPWAGVLYAAAAVLLVASPVTVGFAVAGARPRVTVAASLLAAAAAATWIIASVL